MMVICLEVAECQDGFPPNGSIVHGELLAKSLAEFTDLQWASRRNEECEYSVVFHFASVLSIINERPGTGSFSLRSNGRSPKLTMTRSPVSHSVNWTERSAVNHPCFPISANPMRSRTEAMLLEPSTHAAL